MPPIYRVLWYIYSRNLVQKSKNFTHFTSTDYALFASLVAKVPFNIGHWVYTEIKRFRFVSSSPKSTIPFPNLVSLILFTNKIWYLDLHEKAVKPRMFGQIHLNYMNLSFQEGSGQSRAPSKSRASISRPTETQSSPAPSESQPAPQFSNLSATIKSIVEKAMQETFGTLQTTLTAQYYELSDKLESEVGKLVESVTSTTEKVDSLDDRLENVEGHFEDLDHRFESMHGLYQVLDSKLDKLLQKGNVGGSADIPSPKHFPISSPRLSPVPSPPHHSPIPSSSTPILHSLYSSPSHPEATPILPTPPPLSAPFISSAPPTVVLPTPQLTPAQSSSGDTAELFDEHSSGASISPPHSPSIPSSLALTSPPAPPSLSLTLYSPLPVLQALRASLESGSPILPDDKGGENVKK